MTYPLVRLVLVPFSCPLRFALLILMFCSFSSAQGTPGTGWVTISGSEQSRSYWDCSGASAQQSTKAVPNLPPPGCVKITVYDSGTVSITVNGFTRSVSYGRTSTSSSIASALVTAFNAAADSPVSATLSGSTANLTARTSGANTNYSLSTAVTYDNAEFGSPSFSATRSGPTLTGGTDGTPAATPTFSPTPGAYGPAQSVTISTTTPGATIYYTTNGSTPTTSSTQYTGPITVSVTTTLKAIATAPGYSSSAVATGVYTINGPAATPTFTPVPGAYGPAQTVSISSTTAGATIYYTTNGSTPTTSSTQYAGPITVSVTTTLKGIATASGYSDSAVATGTYTINGSAATPTFSPAPGAYGPAQGVTISTTTPGATIYYTTNGSTPTTSSTQYTGPITVSVTTTLKAIAAAPGHSDSAVATGLYTINGPAAAPTFSPAPGAYGPAQTVTIASTTPGATIYYTTNGSTPTTGSSVYTAPLSVSVTTTIKAIAIAPDYLASDVATGAYTINGPAAPPAFSPIPGGYSSVQTVTLSAVTPGAVIYYTTDQTTPTTSSTQYTAPISVSTTTAIYAIAVAPGYEESSIATATFYINGAAATPVISPPAGTYGSSKTVTIFDATPDATIYYTIDGSLPTTGSIQYTGAINVDATTTVRAIALAPGYSESAVASATYTIVSPPHIDSVSSGLTGQVVAVQGTGFGSPGANSKVQFGSALASYVTWSDTRIDVTVPAGFFGGVVTVVVDGLTSNGVYFGMPLKCAVDCFASPTVGYVVPDHATLLTGETAEFELLDNFSDNTSGVTWSLSDPSLATTEFLGDTLRVTASNPGTLTITGSAGSLAGTAEVTIVGDPVLLDGTTRWSVPTIGTALNVSGFINATPSVNSETAVFAADTTSFSNLILRAYSVQGRPLWAHSTGLWGGDADMIAPTPSGGVVYWSQTQWAIVALDASGRPIWSFPAPNVPVPLAVGHDGTIYAVVHAGGDGLPVGVGTSDLIAIDGTTGQEKSRVLLPRHVTRTLLGEATDRYDLATAPLILRDGSVHLFALSRQDGREIKNPLLYPAGTVGCPTLLVLDCWVRYSDGSAVADVSASTIEAIRLTSDGNVTRTPVSQVQSERTWLGYYRRYRHTGWTTENPPKPTFTLESEGPWYVDSSSSNGAFVDFGMPKHVVPDGNQGLLLGTVFGSGATGDVRIRHVPNPADPSVGTQYTLPLGSLNRLVIGENSTAFAAGTFNNYSTARAISFALSTGTPNWTYDSTYAGSWNTQIDVVSAAPNGGLWVTEGWCQWPSCVQDPEKGVLLDATGSPSDAVALPSTMYLTSAGSGMSTWYGVPTSSAISAVASHRVEGANSSYAAPWPSHVEWRRIKINAFQLGGLEYPAGVSPTQRIQSAIDYWTRRGVLFHWDGAIQYTPDCDSGAPFHCSEPVDNIYDLSSNIFLDRVVDGKEIRYTQIGELDRRFTFERGISVIFVNSIYANGATDAMTLGGKPTYADNRISLTGWVFYPLRIDWNENTVVASRATDDVLAHEFGHVFQLGHIPWRWNLMCVGFILDCSPTASVNLSDFQLREAKKRAACLTEGSTKPKAECLLWGK